MKDKPESSLSAKILQDHKLLQKLTDKVYELMLEDIRVQQERLGNYRR